MNIPWRINSITVKKGESVSLGSPLGIEGTDGGAYWPHCDFGAREISGPVSKYLDYKEFPVFPIMEYSVRSLQLKGLEDFTTIVFKDGEKVPNGGSKLSS